MSHSPQQAETPADPTVTDEQYAGFTDAVRALNDACVRTLADADELARAQTEITAIAERLAAHQIPGTQGEHSAGRRGMGDWGNTVVGLRNAAAMPLEFTFADDRLWAEFTPGALYEGPPGHMHGGVIAMLLDQALGELAGRIGKPGLTANLSIDYKAPTKLNTPLRIEAWWDRTDGWKTWTKGTITSEQGVCAEATGLFILPRWVRELPPEEIAKLHQHD